MGSAPTPPRPEPAEKVAAAQAAANKDTAIAQYGLQATNQYTPYGSLEYSQIGTWADGTPRFSAQQTLTPEQQSILNSTSQAQRNLANTAVDQSVRLQSHLNTPINLNNEAAESRIAELQRARMDPMWEERRRKLDSQLFSRGIGSGTDAYDREVGNFEKQRSDAYNQMFLQGRGQALNEITAQRNQPINEITALLSGSQVRQPSFVNAPTPGVAPTDVVGAFGNEFNGLMGGYNAQQQNRSAMMGGLFGLGSAAILGPYSYAAGGLGRR